MSFGYQVLGFGAFPNRIVPAATSSLVVTGTNVTGGGATHTFSSAALGTSTADRVIIVLTQINSNAAGISGCTVTVRGKPMAVVVEQISVGGATEQMVGIYAYPLGADSGNTSGDIVVTAVDQTHYQSEIFVYDVKGITAAASSTCKDSDRATSNALTGTLAIPAGGFACGISRFGNSRSATWSEPFTERHDESHTGALFASVADATGEFGSSTVSVTPSGTATPSIFVASSFGFVDVDATVQFAGSTVDPTNATTKTFSNHAIGTASLTRKTLVMVDFAGTVGDENVLSVSVGGVTASVLARSNSTGGGRPMEAWLAETPSGTVAGSTADIVVVSNDSNWSEVGIGVYALESGEFYDSFTSQANPGTGQITVPAGGVAIAANLLANSTSATSSFAWSANMTENYDEALDTNTSRHTGASAAFSSLQEEVTITSTPTGDADSQWALAAVSFGPKTK